VKRVKRTSLALEKNLLEGSFARKRCPKKVTAAAFRQLGGGDLITNVIAFWSWSSLGEAEGENETKALVADSILKVQRPVVDLGGGQEWR